MPGYGQLDYRDWGEVGTFPWIVSLVMGLLILAGMWQIFEKAGEAGWKCLVPIYSLYILLKICGKGWWWLLLLLIPLVNIVLGIILYYNLAKAFGHGGGFTIGLIFLPFIFVPLLGFGNDKYVGKKLS